MKNTSDSSKPESKKEIRALLLGGILPLVVYSVVEEVYGIIWGLVAGMVLGLLEVAIEKWRQGKVETITWIGNGLLLLLGGISLLTQEGIWFRMQPAIIELAMGGLLLGSVIADKPFLLMMARKQKTLERMPAAVVPFFEKFLKGFTLRVSFFFLAHAGLAAWAAIYWSTRAWILLKGIGFTGSMICYGVIEILVMRRKIRDIMLAATKNGSGK